PAAAVDLVDALSASFARRAARQRGLLGLIAAGEAARLLRYENELVRRGLTCLVVAESERAPLEGREAVRVVPNGVDLAAFAYVEDGRPAARLVFAGNLGYFPNVDAATFLVRDVLPRVRAAVPGAELRLVGARPARRVRALAGAAGVSLAASVPAAARALVERRYRWEDSAAGVEAAWRAAVEVASRRTHEGAEGGEPCGRRSGRF